LADIWFTEKQLSENGRMDVTLGLRVKAILHREKSQFQDILVIDTYEYGRVLLLDGVIQLTRADEFVYHEMISHVPLFTHPRPEKVLIVGGGDGGTVREVLKHPAVRQVELCELDERVCAVSREYLPEVSSGLADPRVNIRHEDGVAYVGTLAGEYDVIIVDAPDPEGPATGLFTGDFYRSVYRALKPDGLFVAQSESPWYNQELLRRINRSVATAFPVTRFYLAHIPTYQSGMWSFVLGSKRYDPLAAAPDTGDVGALRYYTPELHQAAFVLPQFVSDLLRD
jgi:spermidine synthase